MAISVITSPNDYVGYDNLIWRLLLDSAGVDPIVKRLHYQLYDGGGTAITKAYGVAYTPNGAYINFGDLLKGFLSTPFHDGAPSSVASDYSKEVYLRYWESSYNKDTGDYTETGHTNSSTVTVLNGRGQYFNADPFANYPLVPVLLTRRPFNFSAARDQIDHLYVLAGTTPVTITQTVYAASGAPASAAPKVIPANTAQGVSLISKPWITPAIDDYYRLQYSISAGIFSEEINIYVKDSCEEGLDLYFLESLGGWSSFRFKKARPGVRRNLILYRNPEAGISSTKADNFETFSLETDLPIRDKDSQNFIREMLAAQVHYLKVETSNGSWYQKFILDDSEFTLSSETGMVSIRVKGRLSTNYETLPQE